MDSQSRSNGFSRSIDELDLRDGMVSPGSHPDPVFGNEFMFKDSNLDLNFLDFPSPPFEPDPAGAPLPSSAAGSDLDSPSDIEQSDAVFKFISEMLMDEERVEKSVGSLDPVALQAAVRVDSPNDIEHSDSAFKFISEMLMDEERVEKSVGSPDPLALQAAEKSFYEVIGEAYIPSPDQPPFKIGSPSGSFTDSKGSGSSNSSAGQPLCDTSNKSGNSSSSSDEYGPQPRDTGSKSSNSFSSSAELGKQQCDFSNKRNSSSNGSVGPPLCVSETSVPQNSLQPASCVSEPTMQTPVTFLNDPGGSFHGQLASSHISSFFSDNDSVLQFKRGMEEASKFLPPEAILLTDLENRKLPVQSKSGVSEVTVEVQKSEKEHSANGSRVKKSHHREDVDMEEERSAKQSAVYVEEEEIVEMFDRVLLCCDESDTEETPSSNHHYILQQNGKLSESEGGKSRSRRRGNKKEVVDLRTLLILCAQAANGNDRRGADDLLKQIRQHSSPIGDGSQRTAHYFAEALEARMAGTGNQIYASLAPGMVSAAVKLKAYQVYLSGCPFKMISMGFANSHISDLAEKAKTIHIIDFGILYGFQWPMFFQCLARRPGGPPRIRITGIELPQPGFRPADKIEETGRRLASYCERFKIPFEFIPVAQKWENIQIEDLKIIKNEAVAVNCLYRFENLPDETVVVNSPRDTVLNLISRIKPDVFTPSIVNGSFGAPFFITRFREALFHYSAVFDMFDANMTRVNPERSTLEKSYYGREVMNVVACEGLERVVRPETYKQWQVRIARAGFRQLPVDKELLKKFRDKVRSGFHKDFSVDEDTDWMLQGWKGRIINAASSWVPTQESSS